MRVRFPLRAPHFHGDVCSRWVYAGRMCGRYALFGPLKCSRRLAQDADPALLDALRRAIDAGSPRYNISPHQHVPVLRLQQGMPRIDDLRWGLVPFWAKDASLGDHAFNAHMETVADKPMFRAAFKTRRCLVPASGYFVWKQGTDGKRPYFVHERSGDPLLMAGLWERWQGTEGAELSSFTILTARACPSLKPLQERMPVVLDPDLWMDWLAAPAHMAGALLAGNPDPGLEAYPVSREIGSKAHDHAGLIRPLR